MEDMISTEEGIKIYTEAGLSENTFYRHAREKKIRKTLPADRERGALYSKEDIKKLTDFHKARSKKRVEDIRTVKEDLVKTDWFNEKDLPHLLVLDYEMYGIEESLDLSISYGWWSKNPQVCRMLYNAQNRKDIWGYITVIPMEQETILKLLRREMHERDIRPEHILTYDKGKEYSIYAASVVMKPEHRSHLRGLINSVFNYWCSHYPDHKISKIYAYADSDEGWHLIRHLFFSPRYDIGEKAFELDMRQINPSPLITSFQECLEENRKA